MKIDDLKSKILQLAIQGKLVEQNSEDTPGEILLERISESREKLIKEKKIKKEKPLPEITDEEKYFKIPNGWKWVRLGNVISLISGRDLSSSICNSDKLGIPYIMGASNMTEQGLIIERWIENPTVIGLKDDVMISVKGTIGKLEVINLEEVHLSRQVMSIRPLNNLINNRYILIYLKAYIEKIKEKSSGVIPGISREDILQIPFTLPSVAEQLRIVAKVDELFAIIDELAENKEAMLKNISDTRNKVLQLAIQGKLVEHCEEDEPVEVLLKRIVEEKELLIKEKKIKKEKPLPEITEEEKIFQIPKGWEWCRLGDITSLISGRDLSSSLCNSDKLGIPYIMGASNMTERGIVVERWVENPTVIGLKDDIMISVKGTIGKLEVINLEKVHLSRQVMSIRSLSNLLHNRYILIYLKAYIEKIKEKSSGVIPGISRDILLQISFALPSVAEQLRIVSKVDEIMSYLDELENGILEQDIM